LLSLGQADATERQLNKYQEACDILDQLHRDNCFINDYQYFLFQISDRAKAEDLKQAAGWLRLLSKFQTKAQLQVIGFERKADMRKAVVEKLIELRKQRKGEHLYGFKVSNVAVLQGKELDWTNAYEAALEECINTVQVDAQKIANEAALNTLTHKNFGNNNRRILGRLNEDPKKRILVPSGKIDFSEWNASTLIFLFTNPGKANKYDFETLYRRYEIECSRNNRKPEVTLSAVKEFLTSDEVQLYTKREREGWAQFDKLLPHVYGKRPEFSLTKGGFDGFQVDFNSKIEGKQLMLTVVAVFDYMSEAVTGYDIGFVEDGLMVRNMYRNHLKDFGGLSYIEVESDRFSGNLAEETKKIFEQTCQYFTQPLPNDPESKAPNPKARFVERLLQELNRLAQNFPGWKGTNITSIDKNRKPNPDYRNGNYVEGFAESAQQIIDLINIYNNDKYGREKSRMELCLEHMNPEAPQIPLENIALLLNSSTTSTVRQGKVKIEVNRREYEYAFPEFDKHVHKMIKGYRVKVHFDETDMSTVYLFGQNDQFICTLERLSRVARDKHTLANNPEERAKLGKMQADRTKAVERITRKSLEAEAAFHGLDISNVSIQEAIEIVEGARLVGGNHAPNEEVFAEALNSSNAKASKAFYQERIIRSQGESVPVSTQEKKGREQQLRELEREKAKRRSNDNNNNETF
jgi:hypothetical protein